MGSALMQYHWVVVLFGALACAVAMARSSQLPRALWATVGLYLAATTLGDAHDVLIEAGFDAGRFIVVAEQDILGDRLVRRSRKRRRASDFIAELASLAAGDIVVHSDHGIGRFIGLKTIEAAGAPHDCLEIHYAGDGRLFLPVENIELLSRFGSEANDAVLDRLGGGAWQSRKARLKRRLLDRHLFRIPGRKANQVYRPILRRAGAPHIEVLDLRPPHRIRTDLQLKRLRHHLPFAILGRQRVARVFDRRRLQAAVERRLYFTERRVDPHRPRVLHTKADARSLALVNNSTYDLINRAMSREAENDGAGDEWSVADRQKEAVLRKLLGGSQ
jgi:hypothetical protein